MTRIRNPTLAAAATSARAGRAPPPRGTTSRCAAVEPEEASSTSASGSQPGHLERALQAAVRNEDDTDTVAAIAGVRARLLELQAQWLTFVPKGAVTLEYP